MSKEKLLTTSEVAEILGVTRWRINKMIQNKRLKAELFGKFYLVKESDLEEVKDRKTGRPPKVKD